MWLVTIAISCIISYQLGSIKMFFVLPILLILIALVNTIITSKQLPLSSSNNTTHPTVVHNLQKMIQHETVKKNIDANPKILEEYMKELKSLFPTIFKNMTLRMANRSFLLHFKVETDTQKPFLIMNHSDVVDAPGQWSHPPFAGEVADGKIYGRGVFDTKGSLCAQMQAVEDLMQSGKLTRSFYIYSSFDEETTYTGAPEIVKYFKSQNITLDFVLDEGGAIIDPPFPGLKNRCAMVALAEKGQMTVKFTAKCPGGHSSQPPFNDPLTKLSKLVLAMPKQFSDEIHPITVETFKAVAPHMTFPLRFFLGNTWLFKSLIKIILKRNSTTAAMLRTSNVFTIAQAGSEFNVVPQEASMTANFRFSLHQNLNESKQIVERLCQKLKIEMEVLSATPNSKVALMGEKYKMLSNVIEKVFPDVILTPYFALGGTDARFFGEICDNVYRFIPLSVSTEQLHRMHAIDENIDVKALENAVEFYKQLIQGYGK